MRFHNSHTLLVALIVAIGAFALPTTALAQNDGGKEVLRDCAQDGDLDRDYSDEELNDAYNNMPSDIDEYSNCRDVIRQAQAGGRGSADGEGEDAGGGASGSGGGSSGDYRGSAAGDDVTGGGGTASDNEALANRTDAARNGDAPESATLAETASSSVGKDDSGLPTAAIVALILLAVTALGGGIYALRGHLPTELTSRLPGFGPGSGR